MENTEVYYDLKVSDSSIILELTNHQNPKRNIAANFMLALAIFAFLLPILITILLIIWDHNFMFGIIISYIIMWLCAGYLGKLALWNKYGKEVYIIAKKEFIYYQDYKYFKDNYRKRNYNEIEILDVYYIEDDQESRLAYLSVVLDNDETAYSHSKIPKSAIRRIIENVNDLGFNKRY